MITGQESPDQGTIRIGETVKWAYADQTRTLDPEKTVWEQITGGAETLTLGVRTMNSRGYVSSFNFLGPDQQKKVGVLSGGERNRVHLARTLTQGANVILLDEPTNDLDIPTLEVLEESLLDFPGAVVLVSHDRYLLDRVSTAVVGLDGGEGGVFADYSQWEAWRGEPPAEKAAAKETRAPALAAADVPRKKLSYLEQREWDGMEARILEAEREVGGWQREMQASATDPRRLTESYEKLRESERRVEELYVRWAELEAKVER
jgi:ATP-binding cassette subfamily F protein uup